MLKDVFKNGKKNYFENQNLLQEKVLSIKKNVSIDQW